MVQFLLQIQAETPPPDHAHFQAKTTHLLYETRGPRLSYRQEVRGLSVGLSAIGILARGLLTKVKSTGERSIHHPPRNRLLTTVKLSTRASEDFV